MSSGGQATALQRSYPEDESIRAACGMSILRRRSDPATLLPPGPSVSEGVRAFKQVLESRKSEALLFWPQRLDGIGIIHGLACLDCLGECDRKRIATLFFPWNRNTGSSQKQVLVDREFICDATMPALKRISPSAHGYVLALHSLKHIRTSGKRSERLIKALKSDPGLEHPALFEIMPQHGIQESGVYGYDDQLLRTVQKYTWIGGRKSHLAEAINPLTSPFFLYGVDVDAISAENFKTVGIDAEHGGRLPDIVLIDLSFRARNRLNHNWEGPLKKVLDLTLELYLDQCPPVLAITDDAFVFETLRYDILKEHDKWRGDTLKIRIGPVPSKLILTPSTDPLDQDIFSTAQPVEIRAEIYGTDILKTVSDGRILRRLFEDAGEAELAELVAGAVMVIQNVLGLAGQPQQFFEFLGTHYEGYERQSLGAKYDHLAPYNRMSTILKSGFAGANHAQLADFLASFDALRKLAEVDNPGRRRFDDYLGQLAQSGTKSMVVFVTEAQVSFIEWRLENDPVLAELRVKLADRLLLVDRREAIGELECAQTENDPIEQILFVEPGADDLLRMLMRSWLPPKATVLSTLPRMEQVLRRTRILLQAPGVEAAQKRLFAVQEVLERALEGHTSEIGDLDFEASTSRFGTLDLTSVGSSGGGPLRMIRLSDNFQVRAFDGTELALYEPHALRHFSRILAKEVCVGDQIRVFTPEFVGVARERLKVEANAPAVLKLYHKAIAEAVLRLPGRDIGVKAATLRERMSQIDPMLDLPGQQSIKSWIDVVGLIDAPVDAVRPQAPRDASHFLCFMKALHISEDVAWHYWNEGIVWTRSMRIKSGASFHSLFMGVLIDPDGSASGLDEKKRSEIWRIYDFAEENVATVIANHSEAEK